MMRAREEKIEREIWVGDRRQQVKELEKRNTQRNRDKERKIDRKREKGIYWDILHGREWIDRKSNKQG